jgi:hypothetical protein
MEEEKKPIDEFINRVHDYQKLNDRKYSEEEDLREEFQLMKSSPNLSISDRFAKDKMSFIKMVLETSVVDRNITILEIEKRIKYLTKLNEYLVQEAKQMEEKKSSYQK